MSGRIRTVKPELLEDAVTAGLSDRAFRLFIAVILMADDYGRLRAEPRFIAGQVYWLRECASVDMLTALAELEPLVLFYDIHGQRYAEIRNWNKHQKVSHPGKPRIPPPPEDLPKPSGGPPESLRPDLGSWILDPDLGSPTPTSDPAGGVRPFEQGTASAEAARDTFAIAVSSATKKPFRLATAPYHARDLCTALNEFAPKGSKADALAWLGVTVAAWVGATDAKYSSGWAPSKLLDWLNADKPDSRPVTQVRARNADRQPHDEGWLKRMREREAAGTGTDDPFGGGT